MVEVLKFGQMGQDTKACGRMDNIMVMDGLFILMESSILVSGKIIILRAKACIHIQMAKFVKANGLTVLYLGLEESLLENMSSRARFKMVRSKEKEILFSMVKAFTKVIFFRILSMVLRNTNGTTEKYMLVLGNKT